MKWLRYVMAVLSFMMLSSGSIAGIDPIGWSVVDVFPLHTIIGLVYPGTTYTFVNNLPFQMASPLYIVRKPSPPEEFTFTVDTCSGVALLPQQSCTVSFTVLATTPGTKTISLEEQYGRNVVPLPQLVTIATSGPSPLVTGTVTVPLPANMGAGDRADFEFTYTNNNNGAVPNVTSSAVTINPNAGGGTFFGPIVDTCAILPGGLLLPGASCTVSGTFQAGVAGNYTLHHTLTYLPGGTQSTSLSTSTTATVQVTGAATTPLPNPMGAGEQQPVQFTFTNNSSLPAAGPVTTNVTSTGGTFTPGIDNCNGLPSLAAHASCTINGTFNSGGPGNYSVTADFTYAGGTVSATTNSTGTQRVSGVVSPGLPASIGTGEIHTVVFTYTNAGSGTAYGITSPASAANLVTSGGSCVNGTPTTTCGATLPGAPSAPANQCTVTCDFEATVPGSVSISSTFTYAGGTTPAVTTSSTASQKVVATIPIPIPAATNTADDYPFEIHFTNTGSSDVFGGTAPVVTISPNPQTNITFTPSASCTDPSLPSGQACVVTGTFNPAHVAAGAYMIFASWTYDGGTVSITPMSTNTTFARLFTIYNYCKQDVWYGFSGAPVRNGCSTKNPCPAGSSCEPKADNGKGICYWNNPMPEKGSSFHLGPMTGFKPTMAKVQIKSPGVVANDLLWAGSFAGRTYCQNGHCETADCGGGEQGCKAGSAFAAPATVAEFTLKQKGDDRYLIQASHGLNLSLSIGPTRPTKTTPAYDISAPYYCATPGSADPTKIFRACSWQLKPPAYPNASSGTNYIWVKPGTGTACSAAPCSAPEVCGLSYNNGQFAKVCGMPLGYFTALQACLLNSSSAGAYFDCQSILSSKMDDETLADLNACTNIAPQSAANLPPVCHKPGNSERAAMTSWIKSACPSISAFSGDEMNSVYTCNTHKTENKKVKPNVSPEVKINVTDYTITFCPEMV